MVFMEATARKATPLGVDPTVHTIGFGLPKNEASQAKSQLQCLAQHTGGKFFLAEDANEPRHVLAAISAANAEPEPAPSPVTVDVTLKATNQQDGPAVTGITPRLSAPRRLPATTARGSDIAVRNRNGMPA